MASQPLQVFDAWWDTSEPTPNEPGMILAMSRSVHERVLTALNRVVKPDTSATSSAYEFDGIVEPVADGATQGRLSMQVSGADIGSAMLEKLDIFLVFNLFYHVRTQLFLLLVVAPRRAP